MKRIYYLIGLLCLMFFLFTSTYANVYKWIKVGKYRYKMWDNGSDERNGHYYYYHGFNDYQYYNISWALGCKDWTDESGSNVPIKISAVGTWETDELFCTMPVYDDEGITIRKYMRYQPPTITVDGFTLNPPYPYDEAEEVNPDYIPGTADCMVECSINTSMGITINQRAIGWSVNNHDDYMIFEWTFENTGNIDADDEIELPNQTINGLYHYRLNRSNKFHSGGSNWHSAYGEHIADSLRMVYWYSSISKRSTYDTYGNIKSKSVGFTENPEYNGEVIAHVPTSVTDPTDDPSQPHMTSTGNTEHLFAARPDSKLADAEVIQLYDAMQYGLVPVYSVLGYKYNDDPDVYPNTHHSSRFDEFIYKYPDTPWGRGHVCSWWAIGPYDNLGPGESFTIKRAQVTGSISPEKGWEVANAWLNGTAKDNPPPGCTWNDGAPIDNLPPPFKKYPEFYNGWGDDSENNWAKDCWVSTGKDSIFQNAWNAQWNARNDYDVPIAPPPPSIEVNSRPDKIDITWGSESETASDFAGYRVYRTSGEPYYYDKTEVGVGTFGNFVPIFECGEGTANSLTHSYEDTDAERGQAYYYYITAFDDGVGNKVGVKGKKEVLESGRFLNVTTAAAHLTRPAGTLSSVRVVPNPFNIGAEELQYIGEPNKIIFMDVPGYCTIKIYSESGDLLKTLYHTDGSGDQSWGVLTDQHTATEDGQRVVSGIYIAIIEENNADGTPTGNSTAVKFVIVR